MKLRCAVLFVCLVVVAPTIYAQSSPQQLVVPYWTTEPGWNTQIEIRNNRRNKPISVQTVLRLTDGTSVTLPAITIDPAESKPVDLGLAVAAIASANVRSLPMYGSALLQFDANSSANVFAAAIVRRVGQPIAFHFDTLDPNQTSIPGTRETLYVLPTATADSYVVGTNTSAQPCDMRFAVADARGRSAVVTRTVAPGQTARVSVREMLPDLPASALGSVSVSMSTSSPAFIVVTFSYDESSGFSAVSKVFERDPNGAVGTITMRAPMLALQQPSAALNFPSGTQLQPRVLLKNASNTAITPQVTIRWSGPGATGASAVDAQAIQPGRLRVISLSTDAKPPIPGNANWAGVSFGYSGRLGDIVPITASYDSTGRYGTQTPFSPTVAAKWEGGMWHAGSPTTNTVMTVGNGGPDATTALLTLHFNGGKNAYEIQQQLAPGEQAWVDIGEIIRTQAPDAKGNVISPDVMQGTYSIRDLKHRAVGYLFEGKINIDRTFGHAMYGCARCCGEFPPFAVPSSTTMSVGGLSFQQGIQGIDSCWGIEDDFTADAYNWSSSVSTVAAVSNTGIVSALTAGSTTVRGSVDYTASYAYCPPRTGSPGATVNVVPTVSLSCDTTHLTLGTTNFPSTKTGTCYTSNVSPSGGAFSWSVNKSTVTLAAGCGSTCDYNSANASNPQGDTTITVTYTVNSKSTTASFSGITVHQPTALATNSTVPNDHTETCSLPCLAHPGDGTCNVATNTNCSYGESITRRNYSVLDQFNPPNKFEDVNLSAVTITESVTLTGNTCGGSGVTTGTAGSSPFYDDFGKCDSCCETGGPGCTTNASQTIYANGFAVRSEQLTVTCTSASLVP